MLLLSATEKHSLIDFCLFHSKRRPPEFSTVLLNETMWSTASSCWHIRHNSQLTCTARLLHSLEFWPFVAPHHHPPKVSSHGPQSVLTLTTQLLPWSHLHKMFMLECHSQHAGGYISVLLLYIRAHCSSPVSVFSVWSIPFKPSPPTLPVCILQSYKVLWFMSAALCFASYLLASMLFVINRSSTHVPTIHMSSLLPLLSLPASKCGQFSLHWP